MKDPFEREEPVLSEDRSRVSLAEQIARRVAADDASGHTAHPVDPQAKEPPPLQRGHVCAIYGARGSGKTSFLYTLLAELRKKTVDQNNLVLPRKDDHLAIFRPSDIRADDGLLLTLLEHLVSAYPASATRSASHHGGSAADDPEEKAITEIQKIEIQMRDLPRILDYHKDIASSPHKLHDEYAKVHHEVSCSSRKLHEHFGKILEQRRGHPDRTLVLFIDDVDLQVQRTLELLEILYLFLDRPGVYIFLAADRALLLRAIEYALRQRKIHQPGLAAALLAKYVPYSWMLPIPTAEERLAFLRESPEGSRWWKTKEIDGDLRRLLSSSSLGDTQSPAEFALRTVLPETYRELKRLTNTLKSWRHRLEEPTEDRASSTSTAPRQAIFARYEESLGLWPPLVPAYLTLLAAVEVRWPSLDLLAELDADPQRTAHALEILDADAGADAETKDRATDDPPLLAMLKEPSRLPAEQQGRARTAMHHVARTLVQWRAINAGAGVAERFLFVTFYSNGDAVKSFHSVWSNWSSEEQAQAAHLDLREHATEGRPRAEQIKQAQVQTKLEFSRLAGESGRLWLCAEAPLSFLVWLGHFIDHRRPVVAWNRREFRPLLAPAKLDPPERRGQYDRCELEWLGTSDNTREACVIIDFLNRSAINDLLTFQRDEPADNTAPLQCRLRYLGEVDALFDRVKLEWVLLDVIDLITELRNTYHITTIHLGLVMPDVVAFALGRQLKSRGCTFWLYEREGAAYKRALELT